MNYSQNSLNLLTDAKAVARARAFASRCGIGPKYLGQYCPDYSIIAKIYEAFSFAQFNDPEDKAVVKKLKKAFDKVLSRAYNSPINGCTNTHAVYFHK